MLSVFIIIGKIQAEIMGYIVVSDNIRHTAANTKPISNLIGIQTVINLTTIIPITAEIVIKMTILKRETRQGLCGSNHAPTVSAAISGNIISFSTEISATTHIRNTITIQSRYLIKFSLVNFNIGCLFIRCTSD